MEFAFNSVKEQQSKDLAVSTLEVAAALGMTHSRLCKHIRQHNIPRKRRQLLDSYRRPLYGSILSRESMSHLKNSFGTIRAERLTKFWNEKVTYYYDPPNETDYI